MNKIKIRPSTAGHHWTVTLPSGATREIHENLDVPEWSHERFSVLGGFRCSTLRLAVEQAIESDIGAAANGLPALPYGPAELRAMAEACEASIDVATKTIARLLRERTGRAWSVTRGRGTAYGWLTITAPPKRRAAFGYLSADDQAMLSAALGARVHCQGESVRPCSGVHGSYVFRAAGVPVPDDWKVAAPSWD